MAGRKRIKSRISNITLAGDTGPITHAQLVNAKIELIDETNRVVRKRRENVIERMHRTGKLSLRQYQAADEIQQAYCQNEMLSSGTSDYSRPIVDSSPRPDRAIDMQVNAQSRLNRAMKVVPHDARKVIEHVCWNNLPIRRLSGSHAKHMTHLLSALDMVANKLGY